MKLEAVLVDRCGLIEGAQVLYALGRWVEAADYLDHFPTTVEVASFHGKSERQAWRWRSRARDAFDEAEFESVVMSAVRGLRRQRKRDLLRVDVEVAA